eukprot:CAMPEP_0170580774 /NCGR_PEP_ID=MMETSP0224-20130122/6685_1 /TAXON_ID=285029 /ORGANISM="Togula jolla, Strain CCCM 725" /LENGTH=100 /DNA_ID=CAMNT_0010903865 /DNA_START=214 /DNA_END=517 /DNA_ORIENTATION=-
MAGGMAQSSGRSQYKHGGEVTSNVCRNLTNTWSTSTRGTLLSHACKPKLESCLKFPGGVQNMEVLKYIGSNALPLYATEAASQPPVVGFAAFTSTQRKNS